jgi:exonuclease VII large subunit
MPAARTPAAAPTPVARTPAEIRASIEQNRQQLGASLDRLRGEVVRLTDWRSQLRRHQKEAMIAAGVAGFVLGGGIAALGMLSGGRRRDRRRG